MDTASKVLVVGGVLNIAFGLGLGFVLARARQRDPAAPQALLLKVHEIALLEGILLLALTWALALSDLSAGLETAAAALLVAASVLQDGSAFVNWRQRVENQFAARSVGLRLASINAALATAGIAILVVGVFAGL